MHTFGASAPLKALQSRFGFDPASILTVAREMLSSS
jgi:transketolase